MNSLRGSPEATQEEAPSPPRRPVSLRLTQLLLRLLAQGSHELAASFAFWLWFRPARSPEPSAGRTTLEESETRRLPAASRRVFTYAWGDGPSILLVHGWSGRAAHLTDFVGPLLTAGFRVVALDAPAHGRSRGRRTDVWEFAEAISAIHLAEGPFQGSISHSLGTLALATAVRKHRVEIDRAVCIAPAVHKDSLLAAFSWLLDLPPEIASKVEKRISRFTGVDFWDHAILRVPTLIVHDVHDGRVPYSDALRIERIWPRAKLLSTRGLGHRGILHDPSVIEAAVKFLQSEGAT